jgi:hypothetical protein
MSKLDDMTIINRSTVFEHVEGLAIYRVFEKNYLYIIFIDSVTAIL